MAIFESEAPTAPDLARQTFAAAHAELQAARLYLLAAEFANGPRMRVRLLGAAAEAFSFAMVLRRTAKRYRRLRDEARGFERRRMLFMVK